ncbi:uncharacterized protein LJ206_009197 [Theristicus caerulescens]
MSRLQGFWCFLANQKKKNGARKTVRVELGWKAPGGAGSGGAGSRRLRPRRSPPPPRLRAPAAGAGAAAGAGGPAPGARRQRALALRASGGQPPEPNAVGDDQCRPDPERFHAPLTANTSLEQLRHTLCCKRRKMELNNMKAVAQCEKNLGIQCEQCRCSCCETQK